MRIDSPSFRAFSTSQYHQNPSFGMTLSPAILSQMSPEARDYLETHKEVALEKLCREAAASLKERLDISLKTLGKNPTAERLESAASLMILVRYRQLTQIYSPEIVNSDAVNDVLSKAAFDIIDKFPKDEDSRRTIAQNILARLHTIKIENTMDSIDVPDAFVEPFLPISGWEKD